MNLMDAISNFHLELLPQEWVANVWENDFSGDYELPADYELQLENKDYSSLMIALIDGIEECISGATQNLPDVPGTSDSCFSWRTLCNNRVDFKALLCVISIFLKTEFKELSKEARYLALISSRLYFALLAIPGSLAFNIFNTILYDQALQVFNVISDLSLSFEKKEVPKSQKKKDSKTSKEHSEPVSEDLEILSEGDKQEILRELNLLLTALCNCFEELHFKDDEESLIQTIKVLVTLTQIDSTTNVFQNEPKSNIYGKIVLKSFQVLEQLCNVNHGEIEHTILIMMRFFLPTIVIREEDVKVAIKSNFSFNINTFLFIQQLLQLHESKAVLGVKAVIQQLCVRMPDRTDIRAKVIPHIVQLLQLLPYSVFQDVSIWIISLAHSERLKYRVCAVELISKLLNASDITELISNSHSNHSEATESRNSVSECEAVIGGRKNDSSLQRVLISAILSRTLDASPVLRYKCLSIFASFIISNQKDINEIIKDIFINPYINEETNQNSDEIKPFFDFQDYFNLESETILLPKNTLPSAAYIMQTVEVLVCDPKVFVRKSALNVLLNICLLNKLWLSEKRIKVFVESCKDHSLMTRKFAVKGLTDLLLKYPSNEDLIKAWVQGVVSLIADNDLKCQEKVIESIGNVILDNLVEYIKTRDEFTKLPWKILNAIAKSGKRIVFRSACRFWAVNKSVSKKIFKNIESHVSTEHNFGAWFLIVCLTEFQDFPDPFFISDYFLENIYSIEQTGDNACMLVVEALFLNWKGLDQQKQEEISSKLKESIESFNVPLILISRYLDMCYINNRALTKQWCKQLVQLCEDYMKIHIAPGCCTEINEKSLCKHIHTLGDAAHFHPGVDGDVINYLADIIDPTAINGDTPKWKGTVSESVKAVAIVALGKICLQDHFIAKTYAPVLANALSEDSKDCVKINAMIALTDLCVRFTSVVEDHLGDMCAMLKDEDVNVRINSLKLLLQLVQEDYLKPKGALFFYLLITLRDPSPSVREMIEAFISNMLLKRNPSIMSQFFIQAIFFFNDYEGFGSFSKEGLTAKERKLFSMAGVRNFNERGFIYKFMLSNMRDDHRFKLCNRICVDIFDEVIDGHIPLDTIGSAVLKDALFAMACDEMRLENMRKAEEDSDKEGEEMIEVGRSEAVLGIAKKAFISQIVKANYVECIVPTITKLKRKLAGIKSPLVRDLMICLRELMKDFKEEINDILHADPELAAEVALDLKHVCQEEEPIHDLYGDLNLKEVRVNCERLSEKALSEKMGISIASIKSLQSQSVAIFNSESTELPANPLQNDIQGVRPNAGMTSELEKNLCFSGQLNGLDRVQIPDREQCDSSIIKSSVNPLQEESNERISSPVSGSLSSPSSSSSSPPDRELRKLRASPNSESSLSPCFSSALETSGTERSKTSEDISSKLRISKRVSQDSNVTSPESVKQVKNKKRTKCKKR